MPADTKAIVPYAMKLLSSTVGAVLLGERTHLLGGVKCQAEHSQEACQAVLIHVGDSCQAGQHKEEHCPSQGGRLVARPHLLNLAGSG